MKIAGKIKCKKSVIITPDSLKSLCDIILKHCERIEFSAETYYEKRQEEEDARETEEYNARFSIYPKRFTATINKVEGNNNA